MTLQEVGVLLRDLRVQSGMTLDQLFPKTGMAKGTLSFIERGQRNISFNQLQKILDVYGYHVEIVPNEPPAASPVDVGVAEVPADTEF